MRNVKNKNYKIGITGQIGAGKSTVLNYLANKGYKVISADLINKDLLEDVYHIRHINKLLFNTQNDILDKKLVKETIFNDLTKKRLLENYLHPLILEDINKNILKGETVFIEAALLYESEFDKYLDKVVAVIASKEVILKRLKKRDMISEELILNILKTQKSTEFLKSKADVIINNDFDIDNTYKQIEMFLNKIGEV